MAETLEVSREAWKTPLREHHSALRTGLIVANILPALRTVFTDAEYLSIEGKEGDAARVDELVRILLTKDYSTFERFCSALKKNGYNHWANKLRDEGLSPSVPDVQVPIQFPIIDELSDEFALLAAAIDISVRELNQPRLSGLKTCIAAKLKAKYLPNQGLLHCTADELMSTLHKYWDYLNFEFAQLVVDYLRDDELQKQMRIYKENVTQNVLQTIKECRRRGVQPEPPPNCVSMSVTVHVDPHSYSLHHILRMKNFLVHEIGIDNAFFQGWSEGSITLHFYINVDDVETARHGLETHLKKLQDLQVTKVEISGRFCLDVPHSKLERCRLASPTSTLDILLLGKTGIGKSTTGNKLINADGKEAKRQVTDSELKVVWPVDYRTAAGEIPHFEAGASAKSVTNRCRVITNLATSYRVVDTRGFAPSDADIPVVDANLDFIREVVGVTADVCLKYHRVLYFLPFRDIPERADKYWQDELAVLWHYFGVDVLRNMVLVVTKRARKDETERKEPTMKIDDEFGEGAAEEMKKVFGGVLKAAIKQREDADVPDCPPVVFLPSTATAEDVAAVVRDVKVCEPDGIKLRFRSSTCCNCASVIRYRCERSGSSGTPVEVVKNLRQQEKSTCHPAIIPKYSTLEKIAGGTLHIATLGVPAAIKYAFEWPKKLWPWFTDSEEQCTNCKKAPKAKGCITIGETNKIKGNEITVRHNSEMLGIILFDE